jgi:hypothetical protein
MKGLKALSLFRFVGDLTFGAPKHIQGVWRDDTTDLSLTRCVVTELSMAAIR